jgi:hypothetical protein
MDTYEKEAQDFCDKYDVKVKFEYAGYTYHFSGDTEKRDTYDVTITRGDNSFRLKFGDSLNNSNLKAKYELLQKGFGQYIRSNDKGARNFCRRNFSCSIKDLNKGKRQNPSAYSILSCLTKYDPYSYEDFCSDYGYNGSEESLTIYHAVQKEFQNVEKMFSDCMEELYEIA